MFPSASAARGGQSWARLCILILGLLHLFVQCEALQIHSQRRSRGSKRSSGGEHAVHSSHVGPTKSYQHGEAGAPVVPPEKPDWHVQTKHESSQVDASPTVVSTISIAASVTEGPPGSIESLGANPAPATAQPVTPAKAPHAEETKQAKPEAIQQVARAPVVVENANQPDAAAGPATHKVAGAPVAAKNVNQADAAAGPAAANNVNQAEAAAGPVAAHAEAENPQPAPPAASATPDVVTSDKRQQIAPHAAQQPEPLPAAPAAAEQQTQPHSNEGAGSNIAETHGKFSAAGVPPLSNAIGGAAAQLRAVDPDQVPTIAELLKHQDRSVTTEHETIKKPAFDATQYAAFRLEDVGLGGFVALDNKQETGAFAVSVGCGYFHDPPELPGLAHMLEHMIFLGSTSKTVATAWDELISSRGGMHNAHTKPDVTTFYVTAPTEHIPELLRAFLQHLFNPALLPEQVQSEAMAVQYEHEKNTPDLERVSLHLALKHLSDSGTGGSSAGTSKPVSSKFGTGSLESLCHNPRKTNIDMLASMKRFHQMCYIPTNMSLALRMGRNKGGDKHPYRLWNVVDLASAAIRDILKGQALSSSNDVTSFLDLSDSSVLGGRATSPDLSVSTSSVHTKAEKVTPKPEAKVSAEAETAQELPQGVTLRLVRAHGWRRRLSVYWSAPSALSSNLVELECQPSSLVQYLLEHPMEGGLLATLKQKGFITKGDSFKHWTSRSSIMGLELYTTDKGEAQHNEVMSLIRQFSHKLQSTVTESFVTEYFNNYSNLGKLVWKFQDPLSPLEQVVTSAESSLLYPSRPDMSLNTSACVSLPTQDVLYKEVRRLVEAMAPGKEVIVKLQMNDSSTNEQFIEVPEYGVKYLIEPAAKEVTVAAPEVPKPISCSVPQEQVEPHLPPSVCVSFTGHLPTVSDDDPEGVGKDGGAAPPCVLLSDDNLSILWHNGAPYNKPIVRAFIKARVAETDATAQNDAMGKIFTLILSEHAKRKLSKFHGCGVDLVVAYTGAALVFELQAFSSMYEEVTQGLAAAFQDTLVKVTEDEFNSVVAGLREQTSDFSASTSYELAMDVALSIVRQSRFSQFDLKEQLGSSNLTLANFKTFIGGVMKKTAVDVFVMGDIGASQAKTLALNFVGAIRTEAISYDRAAGTKTLNLAADVEVTLKNPIVNDVNNAFVSFYLSNPPDIVESLLYSMIGDMVRAPFFDTLRTINMDGYVASASVTELPPVVALGTVVQSSLRTPTALEEHVCAFLYNTGNTIGEDLSNAEFTQRSKWVGHSKFSRDKSSFADFFSGMVSQVAPRSFCFIREQLVALSTKNFMRCPGSLKRYFSKLFKGPTRHRVTVKLEAQAETDPTTESLGGQPQCVLPGMPTSQSSRGSPISMRRAGPTIRPSEKPNKLTIQQATEKLKSHQQEQQDLQNDQDSTLQSAPSVAASASALSPPLLLDVEPVPASQPAAQPIGRVGDPAATTTGASADADLNVSVKAKGSDSKDDVKAQQYCATEKASSFAEEPQEERKRLIASMLAKLNTATGSANVWVGYQFDRACSIHESTVRETSFCPDSPYPGSKIAEEDAGRVQLTQPAGDNAQSSAQTATQAGNQKSTAAQEQQAYLFEQQHQQLLLLERLQQQIQQLAAVTVPTTGGFMPARTQTLHQQVQPHQQNQQQQFLRSAEETVPGNAWGSPKQQQQQLMQPRVTLLQRYGTLPSVVFSSYGGLSNTISSQSQPLLEGAYPQAMSALHTARLLQLNEQRLQNLQAQRDAIEEQINDVQQRVLATEAAPAPGAAAPAAAAPA